jgi:hypothetical protein
LILSQKSVKLEVALLGWNRLGPAAQIVRAIVNNVKKMCWRRRREVNRQKTTENGSTLKDQSGGKSVLHLETAWSEGIWGNEGMVRWCLQHTVKQHSSYT